MDFPQYHFMKFWRLIYNLYMLIYLNLYNYHCTPNLKQHIYRECQINIINTTNLTTFYAL